MAIPPIVVACMAESGRGSLALLIAAARQVRRHGYRGQTAEAATSSRLLLGSAMAVISPSSHGMSRPNPSDRSLGLAMVGLTTVGLWCQKISQRQR